jgi:D-alanine-D-alanine ligase
LDIVTSSTIKRATVVFGGPADEHDISILTGLQAERVLTGAGVTVQPVYWARDAGWYLVPTSLEARDFVDGVPSGAKKLEARIGGKKGTGFYLEGGLGGGKLFETGPVLSCFHGGLGEAGGSQALFELLGLRATGGTVAAAALGMDKLAFGGVMEAAGIPVLKRSLLSSDEKPPFDGPYIVKPRFGGSSIGIEVVEDWETAAALLGTSPSLREGAVVEPNRPDLYDLNLSVRTAPTLAVSDVERPLRPAEGAIFSYAEKYLRPEGLSAAPREFPADISLELRVTMQRLATRVVELTGLTGIVRIDFLSDGTDVYVNEVNSIPGALALYLWPDTPPAEVLLAALEEAERQVPQATRNYEEGVALRAAGGIAGKLQALPQQPR